LPALFFILAAFPLFSQEINIEEGEPVEVSLSEESALSEESVSSVESAPSVEGTPPVGGDAHPISSGDTQLYVIAAYEFSIKGRSRPNALLYKLIEQGEFREGELIAGKANLEKYINDITQIYINQRVLKDNVEISYSTGPQNEDGTYPVTIMTKVEDSWNIIALPRPYYKNDVFDLTIKARDYNFLGSMNPLRIDIGYNYNENKRHSLLFGVFSSTPFKAFGYYWNFDFDNTIQYRIDAPFYYQNTTGLSMELPFRSTTFTFGFNERFSLNEENPDWAKENGYGLYQNGIYMSSSLYVFWKVPTGLTVSRFGELAYTPAISGTFNHELPKSPINDFRKGPFLNFSHTLGFEKIDWHANYREGLYVSVGNSYQYDFNDMLNEVSFNITGIGHYIVSDFFAISSRFIYQYWHFSGKLRSGEYASLYMRGIADKSITAYQMFLLNMDFPFRLFVFTPSKWFNNRKISFFDFELQVSPVIDLAVYNQRSFDKDKILHYPGRLAATGGIELVIFPAFMRNLYLRLGFAVNLKEFLTARPVRLPGGDNREIYLIMGHFY
jgi:hypothetical protein